MYNHHNFPKALMTLLKILKLTTAANFIYAAKADF